LTFAAVVFDGIYCRYFLPEHHRKQHAFQPAISMAWLNEAMDTQHITLSHVLYCHRLGASAGEVFVPIQPHFKDPKKKIQLKVVMGDLYQATQVLI
jgi:hypothetical protein